MEILVILVLVGLAVAATAPAFYALRHRLGQAGTLELWKVLARRGLSADEEAAAGRALAGAIRRCALCTNVESCRSWLTGKGTQRLEEFCPNAPYLERLERP